MLLLFCLVMVISAASSHSAAATYSTGRTATNFSATNFFSAHPARTGGSDRSDEVATINPYAFTDWGQWAKFEYCPEGQWATGFTLKTEPSQGSNDDTALNAISLTCGRIPGALDGETIVSGEGPWGTWGQRYSCHSSYFTAAQFRSEPGQGALEDDTAGNNVALLCGHGGWWAGDGGTWGSWTPAVFCPAASAICGLAVRLEMPHGSGADDTALNAVALACCTAPAA